ncbi:MAG: thioredoxin family protein [Aureispira sp.]|nr:thioredoxin family protein [Aureispira sp.]
MKIIVSLIATTAILFLTAFTQFSSDTVQNSEAPKVIAVKFHADWCGSCKAMVSTFKNLQNKHDGEDILFVELNFTNKTTGHQANLLANALGLSKTVEENKGTGFILLVDGKNKKVLKRLTKEQSLKEMSKELRANL